MTGFILPFVQSSIFYAVAASLKQRPLKTKIILFFFIDSVFPLTTQTSASDRNESETPERELARE